MEIFYSISIFIYIKRGRTAKFIYPIIAFSFMIFFGCSPRATLTTALIKEYKLSNSDITRLQLYISDGILLEQEATTINKDIDASHSLKTVQDSYVKQVYFKRLTPCVAVEVIPDKVCVAFEHGDNLTFRLRRSHKEGSVYVFEPEREHKGKEQEKRLSGAGFRNWKIIGKEKYKDLSFNVLIKREKPYLLVDEKGLKKLVVIRHTVPGLKQKGK